MYASGNRPVRSRCASVRASTASVFTLAAAIARVRNGWARCTSKPASSSSSASHSPAISRLERDVRALGVAEQLTERLASGHDRLRTLLRALQTVALRP